VELTSPTASEGIFILSRTGWITLNQILKKKIPRVSVHTAEEITAKTSWTLPCRREDQVITWIYCWSYVSVSRCYLISAISHSGFYTMI